MELEADDLWENKSLTTIPGWPPRVFLENCTGPAGGNCTALPTATSAHDVPTSAQDVPTRLELNVTEWAVNGSRVSANVSLPPMAATSAVRALALRRSKQPL